MKRRLNTSVAGTTHLRGKDLDLAESHWKTLITDPDSRFDTELNIDCAEIYPGVTWGTSPQHTVAIMVPFPTPLKRRIRTTRQAMQRALDYMGLEAGTDVRDIPARCGVYRLLHEFPVSDLRLAAGYLEGKHRWPVA